MDEARILLLRLGEPSVTPNFVGHTFVGPPRPIPTLIILLVTFVHTITANPLIPDDMKIINARSRNFSSEFDSTFPFNSTTDEEPSGGNSISVMWYLVSFGGLVTFFLLLSFSEFCCKKTIPSATITSAAAILEQPSPPPYELFAPPSYESIFSACADSKSSVFTIPVEDKADGPRVGPLEFGEVIRRNPMGDGEVVTPPPPP